MEFSAQYFRFSDKSSMYLIQNMPLYSKASNNAASFSADLAGARFWIGSKITWSQRFLGFFLEQRGFFEIRALEDIPVVFFGCLAIVPRDLMRRHATRWRDLDPINNFNQDCRSCL